VEIVHSSTSIASGPKVSQARLPGKNPRAYQWQTSRDQRWITRQIRPATPVTVDSPIRSGRGV